MFAWYINNNYIVLSSNAGAKFTWISNPNETRPTQSQPQKARADPINKNRGNLTLLSHLFS